MSQTIPSTDSPQGSSPIKRSSQGTFAHNASLLSAEETRKTMAAEMRGLWVGPMPVQMFLDKFVPLNPEAPNVLQLNPSYFCDIPLEVTHEKDMYKPFIDLVEKAKIIPGHKIVDTSSHSDKNSRKGKKIKPDPTMYRDTVDTSKDVMQFGKMELHFEFKVKASCDPFQDTLSAAVDTWPKYPFEATANARTQCAGQLTTYATEWCSRQHRRFAFSILITGPYIRFIRWDRAGSVVSAAFNYHEDSQPLVEFLWRFTHLTDRQRGLDETVRPATEDEIKLAEEHLSTWKNDLSRPVIVFTVPTGEGDRYFIAWGSMADAESLTGRATRAYPVYETLTRKTYFLKDTWRAETHERESDILQILNTAGVRNVPLFVCGGDIEDDVTITDLYADATDEGKLKASWRQGEEFKRVVKRIHHRFVEDFVGKHLNHFISSKQMMQVVYDAFVGHQDAFEKCDILHRDVSGRNILIGTDGRGVLNDWDLAKKVKDIGTGTRHERTGTWHFISTLLLRQENKIHQLQDDLESFVHVVLYHGLRYLPHNITDVSKLRNIMNTIFEQYEVDDDGHVSGGGGKLALFSWGSKFLHAEFRFEGNNPLMAWIDFALLAGKQWLEYAVPPTVNSTLDRYLGHQQSLVQKPVADLHFKSHEVLERLWGCMLESEVWPTGDTVVDALASGTEQTTKKKRTFDSCDDPESGSLSKNIRNEPSVSSSLRYSSIE